MRCTQTAQCETVGNIRDERSRPQRQNAARETMGMVLWDALTWELSTAYIIEYECVRMAHGNSACSNDRCGQRAARACFARSLSRACGASAAHTSTHVASHARRVKGKRGTARSGLCAHCTRTPAPKQTASR